jgi:hypothetical protein
MNFQLYALRRLMQGPEETPKAPLANNVRPLQPLHHRTIRTNIDFDGKSHQVSAILIHFLFIWTFWTNV